NSTLAVQPHNRVLDVAVINPIRERADKFRWIYALPNQMARGEVEPKRLTEIESLERPLRRVDIKCKFRGMDFECKLHATPVENIEDGVPSLGQQIKSGLNHFLAGRRKGIQQVPDVRAREPVDHAHAQSLRGTGGVFHLLGRAAVYTRRITVGPNVR